MTIHRYDPRGDLIPMDIDAALERARNLLERTRGNPDAARFTLEQCEDHVARMEALKARQERAPNAAISGLLQRPAEVIADPSLWPHAADLADGSDLLADAYRTWLFSRAREVGGPWPDAAEWVARHGQGRADDRYTSALGWLLRHAPFPFPVGASCQEFNNPFPVEAAREPMPFPAEAARELMPFPDDAHAAVVLTLPVGGRTITIFFMARQERYDVLLDGEWEPAAPAWVIDGTDVRTFPPRPRDFGTTRRDAGRWWRSLGGLKIEAGQRNRKRERSPRQMIDALIEYKHAHGPEPPSQEQFMGWWLRDRKNLGSNRVTPNPETWKRLLREMEKSAGLTWPDLVRAVYGDTRRRRHRVNHG